MTAAVSVHQDAPGGDADLCETCGHDWEAHRLCGHGAPPTEGWIECPVAGCACDETWSVAPEVAAQIRARH